MVLIALIFLLDLEGLLVLAVLQPEEGGHHGVRTRAYVGKMSSDKSLMLLPSSHLLYL